ncbi:hypothetical protein OEZ86_014164 [Tetradesmus obliquus]|nr:hypothetical protein OEZ86_014164 [Tetradesmus obliquus]
MAMATEDAAATTGSAAVPTAYFGNGCFWGRQKDFVDTELRLGRTSPADISALVGYAGGKATGPDGKVCYYYNGDPRTIYERLGHAEVVQVALSQQQQDAQQEFQAFAGTYFKQFQQAPRGRGMMRLDPQDAQAFAATYFKQFQQAPRGRGMMRLDPQDAGPGYRNVVGLPGGVSSPYYKLLQAANVNGMELREGKGNVYERGQPVEGDEINVVWVVDSDELPFYRYRNVVGLPGGVSSPYYKLLQAANVNGMELREGKGNVYERGQAVEGDEINVVWVVDSDELPFYRAEVYHQFHNGLGKAFSPAYTRDLKQAVLSTGKIAPTGCLEVPF